MSVVLPTTKKLLLKIEDSYQQTGPELMTNSGDNQAFSSTGTRFSLCPKDENGVDRRPIVKPDGLKNGCYIYPSASIDTIDVKPGTIIIAGAEISVVAVIGMSVVRPATNNVKTISITVSGAGVVSVVDGVEASSFSDTRGAGGGPPFIPLGMVELGLVKLNSSTSALITEDEISFLPELSHFPGFEVQPSTASIRFSKQMPLIHTGGVCRNVYITFCQPQVVVLDILSFAPPVVSTGYSFSTQALVKEKPKPGKIIVHLSGAQSDFSRRLDKTVRYMELMPDSTGTRKEIYFASLETSLTYLADSIVTGEISIIPIHQPEVETV